MLRRRKEKQAQRRCRMWSGKSYTEAVKTLSDAGFEVTFEGETTNSTVTAQDPKYGVSVEADSEVKITLTKKEAAEETAEEPKKTTQ